MTFFNVQQNILVVCKPQFLFLSANGATGFGGLNLVYKIILSEVRVNRVIRKVTLSLGLLSPPILSLNGIIGKVMKIY
jgi:hypothetical protein